MGLIIAKNKNKKFSVKNYPAEMLVLYNNSISHG